ncbi:Hypothetical_protein [Hexamita inflata]|uniref:Hypothetical_protein n=1 Tax=Hexamita inflata TaxID=28002 RepID=A0ABP1GW00_9EUKA
MNVFLSVSFDGNIIMIVLQCLVVPCTQMPQCRVSTRSLFTPLSGLHRVLGRVKAHDTVFIYGAKLVDTQQVQYTRQAASTNVQIRKNSRDKFAAANSIHKSC